MTQLIHGHGPEVLVGGVRFSVWAPRDGRHGELRGHYRDLLGVRRRHAKTIGSRWPSVATDGRAVTLRWPGLEVAVNLGKEPAGGLPAWGWCVKED
jgi:hypothetical protein